MIDHYGITQEQFATLEKKYCVTIKDLFHGVQEFNAENAPLSKISLMHYLDNTGRDFTERATKLDCVACEVFSNLDKEEKSEIINYMEYIFE